MKTQVLQCAFSLSRRSLLPLRTFSATATLRGPLLKAVQHDQQQLRACYPHIIEHKDVDERVRYQNLFVWELARHTVAKEIIIYPVMEELLGDGVDGISSSGRERGQKIKEQLAAFQKLKADDTEFSSVFERLYSDVRKHLADDAEQGIPRLEDGIDHARAFELSEAFERAKRLAPTRGHAPTQGKAPFETAAALLAAPIDKVADIFRKFPKEN